MDNKICGIYKITSPSGKVYIGQTNNSLKRINYYENIGCKDQRKLYYSILKYGWEAHIFEIIEECSVERLDEREMFWIEKLDTCNTEKGLNLTKGGGGSRGRIVTDSFRAKLRASRLGKKASPETIAKRVAKLIGQKRTQETKDKMRLSRPGFKHSEEAKRKISISLKGKIPWNKGISTGLNHRKGCKHSEETKLKMRKPHKKFSEETKRRLGENRKGVNNNFFGKKHSEETKKRMRKPKSKKLKIVTQ